MRTTVLGAVACVWVLTAVHGGEHQTPTPAEPAPSMGADNSACAKCHSETQQLPAGQTFDAAGIYPFATQPAAFSGGTAVPLLAEAIELAAEESSQSCTSCHAEHGAPSFEIGKQQRIENMGLWANIKPSPPGTLHLEVKVRNLNSGHRAPAGRIGGAYVVTAEARQHREQLSLRFGPRVWSPLRSADREAGIVFGRDYRDSADKPTSDPKAIATLRADTRLESGRFQTVNFMFDRVDDSTARIEAVLWYLPDVTTWDGAVAIRRAEKPEPQ